MTGLLDKLRERLKGKVLIVGIGNSLRGDDGVGPKIIEALEGKVRAELLAVGDVPESYTGTIIATQPDTIVFIDAADFGAAPGDLAILDPGDFTGGALLTHRMSLGLVSHYISQNSDAGMFTLGIQPAVTGWGESMSPSVARSAERLAELLEEVLA